MFVDPVFRLRAGRELPRPPSWGRLDGGLQAVAEEIPPWWKFPHLTASHTLFLWFFLMLDRHRRAARVRHLAAPPRRLRAARPCCSPSPSSAWASSPRPSSGPTRPTCCGSRAWRSRSASWPSIEVVRRIRPRIDGRAAATIGAAVALGVTFVFTSLFTFRYYLLHTRVGLGQVPQAFPVERDGRYFYLGDYRAYLGVQAAVDELGRLAEPGDRLLVGPSDLRRTWYSDAFIYWLFPELDPATYYIEMDPGLANAEGSSLAGDVDVGRLRHPHRAVGRLDGAQLVDGLRLRRAEPGAPRPLLRGRRLRGRPGRPLPPLPVTPGPSCAADLRADDRIESCCEIAPRVDSGATAARRCRSAGRGR